jgi:hypothetical protein
MLGIETLDVMIGIITIYLIFALACTAIVEAISSWRGMRSKNLETALKEFLHGNITVGNSFVDAFFSHPIVRSLSKGSDGRPSYIPPEIVGQVVTSLIYAQDKASTLGTAISNLQGTTQDNRIKGLLDTLHGETKEDIEAFRKLIEKHYDAAMDRASGWYKRHTQLLALITSAVLVIGANVDTINIANSLSSNPTARAKMVEIAQREVDAAKEAEKQTAQNKDLAVAKSDASATDSGSGGTAPTDPAKEAKDRTENAAKALAAANADLSSAGIQLGWKGTCPNNLIDFLRDFISKIFGLLISILAISLGAPFWFDMLNRVMQVRAAGVSPREKKPEVGGEAKK